MFDSRSPMDCSPPGSSVHGILQARILEWVVISFSRGSSPPINQTWVSCIAGRFFTNWATREAINGIFTLKWFSLFSNSIGKVMYKFRSISYFGNLSACILLLFTLRSSVIEAVVSIFLFLFLSFGIMCISLVNFFSQNFVSVLTYANIEKTSLYILNVHYNLVASKLILQPTDF